ncbi:Mrp/NBP35 family ATP-binding protein [Youngiibacter fragilis]|uniref:Mrp/NBP35 family ATP-binding protein n=1 Tax=Youngiibacter fragilis TaxID=1408819 RepID=UPI0004153CC8|nr:Mrp/NBP35 family ATP-binding protein [Youngiibacter fragilis]
MSEGCNGNCSSCGEECEDRKEKQSLLEDANEFSRIGKVIGVVSGKGGVGKSLVTSMLAVAMNREGFETAILDADLTGPSIPKAFGLSGRAFMDQQGIYPMRTATGIGIMSSNLLLENDTDPIIWRGPLIANAVKQFWKDVVWGDVDYMFIDMPPGTGDVPLTVFQSIAVDGIIIVTSPQELVSMIVAKAVNMARSMNIPVLGIVENMSYFECDECSKKHYIFGDSHLEEVAAAHGITMTARLPIDPELARTCDRGEMERYIAKDIEKVTDMLQFDEENTFMEGATI